MTEVLLEHGLIEEGLDVFVVLGLDRAVDAVAFGKADPDMLRLLQLVVAAPLLSGSCAGADTDEIDGAMARVVIGVAEEIFGRELPVRRKDPFMDADHLGAALASVPAIQRLIEMDLRIAKVGQELRCILVPGRPDRALVDRQLRDLGSVNSHPDPVEHRTAICIAARPAACRRSCRSSCGTGK